MFCTSSWVGKRSNLPKIEEIFKVWPLNGAQVERSDWNQVGGGEVAFSKVIVISTHLQVVFCSLALCLFLFIIFSCLVFEIIASCCSSMFFISSYFFASRTYFFLVNQLK